MQILLSSEISTDNQAGERGERSRGGWGAAVPSSSTVITLCKVSAGADFFPCPVRGADRSSPSRGGQVGPGQGDACAANASSAPTRHLLLARPASQGLSRSCCRLSPELEPPGRGTAPACCRGPQICPSSTLAVQSQCVHLLSSSSSSSLPSMPSLRVPWQWGQQGWLREELQRWCEGSEQSPGQAGALGQHPDPAGSGHDGHGGGFAGAWGAIPC